MPPQNESNQNPLSISQNFLINQIASGLATTTELIQSLSSEIKENAIDVAIMKADLTNLNGDVRSLSKILKEGNGTAPVLSRIAVLESSSKQIGETISNLDKDVKETKSKLDLLIAKVEKANDNRQLEIEDKKSRRQAIIAIITSIVALISAIAVAFLG